MSRWPRKIVPTKTGLIFFGFLGAAVLFGYTTNNNLLFLLFSGMLAVIVLSGLLSEASVGMIRVTRTFPGEIFAGSPVTYRVDLTNRSKRLTALAFRIKDIPELTPGPFVAALDPRATTTVWAGGTFARRGLYRLPSYHLATFYPFLVFEKLRPMEGGEEVLVFPRLKPVRLDPARLFGIGGEGMSGGDRGDGVLSFVRELGEGETPRRIDWKKSARSDVLFVKEDEAPRTLKVTIHLALRPGESPEEALSVAASVRVRLHQLQVPTRLWRAGPSSIPFEVSKPGLVADLTALALWESHVSSAFPPPAEGRTLVIHGDGRYDAR